MAGVYTQFMKEELGGVMNEARFLRSLAEEMGALDLSQFKSPQKRSDQRSTFIGDLSDDLKRLFVLLNQDQKKLRSLSKNFELEEVDFGEVERLEDRIEILNLIFIRSLEEAFESELLDLPLLEGHYKGVICEGWQFFVFPCGCDGLQVEVTEGASKNSCGTLEHLLMNLPVGWQVN